MKVYIEISEVARILGWRLDKTTRWLERAGALVERGGRRVTTRDLLKQSFPEVYQEILDSNYDPDEDLEEAG